MEAKEVNQTESSIPASIVKNMTSALKQIIPQKNKQSIKKNKNKH